MQIALPEAGASGTRGLVVGALLDRCHVLL